MLALIKGKLINKKKIAIVFDIGFIWVHLKNFKNKPFIMIKFGQEKVNFANSDRI